MWFLDLNYDHEFTLYRGINYPESLKCNTGDIVDIKSFIEIAYNDYLNAAKEKREALNDSQFMVLLRKNNLIKKLKKVWETNVIVNRETR